MTCIQNHKTLEECLRSDCAPRATLKEWNAYGKSVCCHADMCGTASDTKSYGTCLNCYKENYGYLDIPKNRMTPDETFIQWLKIIGLSIGLGVMVYQTYLLKLISEK